jgi:hypothetical protein
MRSTLLNCVRICCSQPVDVSSRRSSDCAGVTRQISAFTALSAAGLRRFNSRTCRIACQRLIGFSSVPIFARNFGRGHVARHVFVDFSAAWAKTSGASNRADSRNHANAVIIRGEFGVAGGSPNMDSAEPVARSPTEEPLVPRS